MQLTISPSDLTDFMRLPSEVRTEVEAWKTALENLTPPIVRALRELAAARGASVQTAIRKYYAFRSHGWRGLVNRSRIPDRRKLGPELIEHWKALCEQNGRKCKPAYREFVRQFRAGDLIPGLPAGTPRHRLPPGLSYRSLCRHAPTKFELTAARIGRSSAAAYRPKPLTSRVGLDVGSRYLFDDMWHDFEITNWSRKPGRLLQLHAHDLLSACQFARGLKGRYEDPETGSSVSLREDEMLFLVAYVLSEFGWHPNGTILMVEHGTAAIREALERMIYDLTGGRVTVERSGREGVAAFDGQYAGRSKGNFRFKACLESSHNLIHNETADITVFPGQTGSNSRINQPEELHGRERHHDALVSAIVALPRHIAAQLLLPFLEENLAKRIANEVCERINQRTEHELQGWKELGFTVVDMFIDGVGLLSAQKYLALPADRRAAVDAVAQPRPRMLSPREVFDAGRKHLVKLRPEQSAALLQDTHGIETVVRDDHTIAIENAAISPEPIIYTAHHFAPGDKFRAVVNPFSTDQCHLFDARGSWVGQVQLWQRISQADPDALHRQMGRAAKIERELLAPVARRGADITRQRLDSARHNAQVLASISSASKNQPRMPHTDVQDFESLPDPKPAAELDAPSISASQEDALNEL